MALRIQAGELEQLGPLWEDTRRLILHISRRYAPDMRRRGNWIDWEDIEQSGFLALVAAVQAYDPAKGWAFNSYLRYSILGNMARCIGREPPYTLSLEEPIAGEDGDLSLADLIPDPKAEQAFEEVQEREYTRQLRECLDNLLASFPPEQAQVLRLRFGEGRTLDDIAQSMGISRGKVSTTEAKALRNLRCSSGALEDFL